MSSDIVREADVHYLLKEFIDHGEPQIFFGQMIEQRLTVRDLSAVDLMSCFGILLGALPEDSRPEYSGMRSTWIECIRMEIIRRLTQPS